jgi:hypothetical protein
MSRGTLDRRTLVLLAIGVVAVLLLRVTVFRDREPEPVVQASDSIPVAEQRLERLRRVAALAPARQAELKQAETDLAAREKGLIAADTAAQAQAQLLELLKKLGQKNGIQVRGAEELRVRAIGPDYGEVSVTVAVTCGIEQLVNLLADLANDPQLVSTNEIRIAPANVKEKTVAVRLGVSGVVPRKLVPEKKGAAAF